MRLEQLECFEAVTRVGSMRRASESLHVSQPAISESIRNLERELGGALLDRRRSGAQLNDRGRELLPYITDVLTSVECLRAAAGREQHGTLTVRIGTVSVATVSLLVPAIQRFRDSHRTSQVEVVTLQQEEIRERLLSGELDIGLVNLMAGDSVLADLESVVLLRGQAVLCCRVDDPLAGSATITIDQLLDAPFVSMRAGYAMHRFLTTLLGDRRPDRMYTSDGADMGKLMVAQGLGVTVLPDFSIEGDPLHTNGLITYRPLAADGTEVRLVAQLRQAKHRTGPVRDLLATLISQAGQIRRGQADDQPATRALRNTA